MQGKASDLQTSFWSEEDVPTRDLLSLPETTICDVWAHNFFEEIKKLMDLTQRFNVIAMDTEFPGIYASRSEMDQRYFSEQDCEYILIKRNVEETKIIQVGLTIADEDGQVPYPICTWQFNFRFDKEKQKIVDQSYDLLTKAGVRFDKLVTDGIDFALFAEYFTGSNMVLNPRMKWVVFHGSSDFAYLLKLALGQELPSSIEDFYRTMKIYFPNIYDLKYVIKDIPSLKDVGLAKLSYEIGCSRIGPQHQAGSDSLLTLCCYFKMLEQPDLFGPRQFASCLNIIFGIGIGFMKNAVGSFPSQRDYVENNNYIPRQYDYPRDYYEARGHNHNHNHGHNHNHNHNHGHGHNYLHMPYNMANNYGNGPLYQYLQLQQQPNIQGMYNYVYHDHQQKRY